MQTVAELIADLENQEKAEERVEQAAEFGGGMISSSDDEGMATGTATSSTLQGQHGAKRKTLGEPRQTKPPCTTETKAKDAPAAAVKETPSKRRGFDFSFDGFLGASRPDDSPREGEPGQKKGHTRATTPTIGTGTAL